MSLQTAVSGEADLICTVDKHFYDPETLAFCAALGIEVSDDQQLFSRIAKEEF